MTIHALRISYIVTVIEKVSKIWDLKTIMILVSKSRRLVWVISKFDALSVKLFSKINIATTEYS